MPFNASMQKLYVPIITSSMYAIVQPYFEVHSYVIIRLMFGYQHQNITQLACSSIKIFEFSVNAPRPSSWNAGILHFAENMYSIHCPILGYQWLDQLNFSFLWNCVLGSGDVPMPTSYLVDTSSIESTINLARIHLPSQL